MPVQYYRFLGTNIAFILCTIKAKEASGEIIWLDLTKFKENIMKCLKSSVLLLLLVAFATQVFALTITPTSGELGTIDTSRWEGDHKNWETDLEDLGINWWENQVATGNNTSFLEVGHSTPLEVGHSTPGYFVFDSFELGWDRKDAVILTGIWAGDERDNAPTRSLGFSKAVVPVPEPTTMVLFGFGLLGFAGFYRKKIIK